MGVQTSKNGRSNVIFTLDCYTDKTQIMISFNGTYSFDNDHNIWKHETGDMFSLFVKMDITLNGLLDRLYSKLGVDPNLAKLTVKALSTSHGMTNMTPEVILDDDTLTGYIYTNSSCRNVIFCVDATPIEPNANSDDDDNDDECNDIFDGGNGGNGNGGNGGDGGNIVIDLNEDCNDPYDNYYSNDYGIDNFPTPVQELARDPDFNPFEQQYVSTQRYGQGFGNSVPTQISFDVGPSHQQFQDPLYSPSISLGSPPQQPYNNALSGSFTAFLNAPLVPNVQSNQAPVNDIVIHPGGSSTQPGGSSTQKRQKEPMWRVPVFDNDDLPACMTTGTICVHNDEDELFKGRIFSSKDDCKLKICSHAVKNNFQMLLSRTSPDCVYYVCAEESCKWSVRARKAKDNDQFFITKLGAEHTCSSLAVDNNNRNATALVVADMYCDKMEKDGNAYKPKTIMTDIKRDHGVTLTYDQAYRAHSMMKMMVRGSPTECYNALPSYLYMLEKVNPGTQTDFRLDNLGRFGSCFISLGSSRAGFRFCRPILCVDATHLKTRFCGQLFLAVGVDPCDRLFPVAYGIAESECNDSWMYFMIQLKKAISGLHSEDVAFVSDRHQAIRQSLTKVFRQSYHGVCYHHLKRNLIQRWKNAFPVDTFYEAAYAYSETEFNRKFQLLGQQCPGAHAQLVAIGTARWARSQFPTKRYAIMTSNYAESFNNVLRGARRWPVPSLLEFIRATLQRWYYERREEALKCETELATDIHEIVTANLKAKRKFEVNPINANQFEVVSHNLHRGVVDITKKECYCGYFQTMEIPCVHALVASAVRRISPPQLCSQYYRAACYKKIYNGTIYPLPNREDWDVPEALKRMKVKVPNVRYKPNESGGPPPGPTPTTRRPSEWERQPSLRLCTNCGCSGHNRAGCSQFQDGLE